jgi:hypothetical protein
MAKFVELEVELLDHEPRSHRRFLIPKTGATLALVHDVIQEATGWNHAHLAAFTTIEQEPIARLTADPFGDDNSPRFSKVTLASVRAKHGNEFFYNYDFGDDWWCAVIVRGDVDVDAPARPAFVHGEGPWPPDDCGGMPGFEDLLALVAKRDAKKKLTADERDQLAAFGTWRPDLSPTRLPHAKTLTNAKNSKP